MHTRETTCCIVGGGPAGILLGFLLARANVPVIVLEKHVDFLRDFRGDTVHPSTLQVLYELGLLEEFLKIPHQELTQVTGVLGDFTFHAADFGHVPERCKFVALMPQWDFLTFLSDRARSLPGFDLRLGWKATDLLRDTSGIVGVAAQTPAGPVHVRANLVVACDGRHSAIRKAAGLELETMGVPIDVLWFRLPREAGDPDQLFGNVNYGKALILINRGDYFQAGFIIAKGSFDDIRTRGLPEFRHSIRQVAPNLGERVESLRDRDQIKLLSVQINRLFRWHADGLLCIGDAAHAMSPAGGVGINLAIQDAVAAANLLLGPLRRGRVSRAALARVQQRREFPARVTQWLQVQAHKALAYVFAHPGPLQVPVLFRLAANLPGRKRLFGRLIGSGIRPEHIAAIQAPCHREPDAMKTLAVRLGAFAGGVAVALRALTMP